MMVLVAVSNFDLATRMGGFWMDRTIEKIKAAQVKVIELRGDSVRLEPLTHSLSVYNPSECWMLGHGTETKFTGQDREVILEKGINEKLMERRVCHLFSCLTGTPGGLAESIAEAGALVCIGYASEFIIGLAMEPYPESKITQSLCEPDGEIELSLADGKNCVEAFEASDEKTEWWLEWWRGSGYPDADLVIWSLLSNQNAKMLYGVPEAQIIIQAPPVPLWTMMGFWMGTLGVVTQTLYKGEKA